jgi:hypothetical protein
MEQQLLNELKEYWEFFPPGKESTKKIIDEKLSIIREKLEEYSGCCRGCFDLNDFEKLDKENWGQLQGGGKYKELWFFVILKPPRFLILSSFPMPKSALIPYFLAPRGLTKGKKFRLPRVSNPQPHSHTESQCPSCINPQAPQSHWISP